MKSRPLGCLTYNALFTFGICLILILLAFFISGPSMFSPGELAVAATGSEILGGVSSHNAIGEQCSVCHPALFSGTSMSDLCVVCHTQARSSFNDRKHPHYVFVLNGARINCMECHTEHNGTAGRLSSFTFKTTIDHFKAGFSLLAHQGINANCGSCHSEGYGVFSQQTCLTCHNQFAIEWMTGHIQVFSTDCLDCHDGIETYGSHFDHQTAPFPMIGQHLQLDCSECHQTAHTMQDLKNTESECFACHGEQNIHQGESLPSCEECHNPEAWSNIHYNHMQTGWPLEYSHQGLRCETCHLDNQFVLNANECRSCHQEDDAHEGQFILDCAACHSSKTWQDVSFEHTLVNEVDCIQCHSQVEPQPHFVSDCSLCHSSDQWLPASFDHSMEQGQDCTACHSLDAPLVHYPGQCSACHIVDAWLPASFNHQVAGATNCLTCHLSDAPLVHFSGQCSACHVTEFWLPAFFNHAFAGASNCLACHSATSPANHYSGQCSTCHSTSAWLPASFNHSFPTNHRNANNNCSLCHPGGVYSSYTCEGCHEHEASRMDDKHKEVSGYSSNCVACHPTGQGGDD